jgi:DNA-binding NtrC family response regulator
MTTTIHETAASDLTLVGDSAPTQALRAAIAKMVASDAPVMLSGETGVGKRLAARLIHQGSARRAGPFVAVNCCAQPGDLFASRQVAVRGADGLHLQGLSPVESANGGTLFLDDVDSLSPECQAQLLRLLEDGSFERPGKSPGHADVRVVTASHADLGAAVQRGAFRDDLFYRLSALQLRIPPLRERHGDVEQLAQHFLQQLAAQHGRPEMRFSDQALRALRLQAWPGNVRELHNRVMQAVIMCDGNVVTPEHLALDVMGTEGAPVPSYGTRRTGTSLRERRLMAEREAITEALRESHGQVPMAASLLGISRAQLYRLIGRLRLPHGGHLAHRAQGPLEPS